MTDVIEPEKIKTFRRNLSQLKAAVMATLSPSERANAERTGAVTVSDPVRVGAIRQIRDANVLDDQLRALEKGNQDTWNLNLRQPFAGDGRPPGWRDEDEEKARENEAIAREFAANMRPKRRPWFKRGGR